MNADEIALRKRITALMRGRGSETALFFIVKFSKESKDTSDESLRLRVEKFVAEYPRHLEPTPWQPIATAPKFEGDFELLLFYGDTPYIGYWDPDFDSWHKRNGDRIYPSHWAPCTKPTP